MHVKSTCICIHVYNITSTLYIMHTNVYYVLSTSCALTFPKESIYVLNIHQCRGVAVAYIVGGTTE